MASLAPRAAGLNIVVLAALPFAYRMVKSWARRNGHRLALVVTTPGPSIERNTEYREIIACAAPDENILISTEPRRLAAFIQPLQPDLIVSFTYPFLIPPSVVAIAPLGGVNLHPAPLPLYRGPNPARMVYDGHPTVGATLHRLEPGFDTGPILSLHERPLPEDLTIESLWAVWVDAMLAALREGTERAIQGGAGIRQDHAAATYAARFTDRERLLEWHFPARTLQQRVVALNLLRPQARAALGSGQPTITRLTIVDHQSRASAPGTVLEYGEDSALVLAMDGAVRVEFLR
jgi:methionyl-tRNA formyltransferase